MSYVLFGFTCSRLSGSSTCQPNGRSSGKPVRFWARFAVCPRVFRGRDGSAMSYLQPACCVRRSRWLLFGVRATKDIQLIFPSSMKQSTARERDREVPQLSFVFVELCVQKFEVTSGLFADTFAEPTAVLCRNARKKYSACTSKHSVVFGRGHDYVATKSLQVGVYIVHLHGKNTRLNASVLIAQVAESSLR